MSQTEIYESAHEATMNVNAYMALRGRLVFVKDNREAQEVLERMRVIGGFKFNTQEVLEMVFKYCQDGVIHSIVTNTVRGCRHITFVLCTDKHPVPKKLDTEEGVFAYVYNIDCTYESELGYVFFENKNSVYHRIA